MCGSLFHTQVQGYTNPRCLFVQSTKFSMVAPSIFGIIIVNIFLTYKIVHYFTHTDITPDNSEVHRSLLNCSFLAWNLLCGTVQVFGIWKWLLLTFGKKVVGHSHSPYLVWLSLYKAEHKVQHHYYWSHHGVWLWPNSIHNPPHILLLSWWKFYSMSDFGMFDIFYMKHVMV
jgi:hypothetical protein